MHDEWLRKSTNVNDPHPTLARTAVAGGYDRIFRRIGNRRDLLPLSSLRLAWSLDLLYAMT